MLPKPQRLPAFDIPGILKGGTHVRDAIIEFVYKKTTSPSRFAVVVSTRIDKRATARNRMKRLVREAIQDVLLEVAGGTSGIFIIRGRLPDTEHNVRTIVQGLLRRAHVLQTGNGDLK